MPGTVLIANNDTTALELICAVLTRNGYQVVSTNDGGDALARYLESSPDVVVAADDLPSLTGAQLCKQIRAQGGEARLVVLCGAGTGDECEAGLEDTLGCDAVLRRPFRFGPLRELLTAWGLDRAEEEEPEEDDLLTFSVPASEIPKLAPPEAVTFSGVAEVAPPTPPPEYLDTAGNGPIAVPIPIPMLVPGAPDVPIAPALPEEGPELELDAVTVEEPPELVLDEVVEPEPGELELTDVVVSAEAPGPAAEVVADRREMDEAALAEREALRVDLERRARRTVLPEGVPRSGDLESMPLPRLLFELYLGTYTGSVRLSRKGAERTIYFRGGFPVYVDSSQLDETLSSVLERSGRITAEQLEQAKQVGSERDVYMGEALVSIGALRESELLEALRDQTEYKLVTSFSWRDGVFAIEDIADFPEHVVLSEIHPLTAILRGISAHYELSALFRYFSKLQNRYVVSTPMFAVHHGSILPHLEYFKPEELLDGQTTFERALRSDDAHSLEIAQALYVLLVTDMVRPSKKPGDPAPRVEAPVEEKAAVGLADYQGLMDAADRVAHRYLRAKGSDYFALLGVSRDASTREVARAYRKQVAEIREDAGLPGLPHDSQRRALELIDLLDKARGALTNAKRRAEYVAELPDETEEQGKAEAAGGRHASMAAERAYKLGMRALNEGDADGAYEKLDGAVRANPIEPAYRVALAQAIQAKFKENPGQALGLAYSHVEQAIRIDPGNILANLEAARIFLGEKQTTAARSHVDKVLQRAPHHKGALKLLADIESAAETKSGPTPGAAGSPGGSLPSA